jgi:hypothetical protein
MQKNSVGMTSEKGNVLGIQRTGKKEGLNSLKINVKYVVVRKH